MKRIRIYHIYQGPRGLSSKSVDYQGETLKVAATSIKQAYYFAGNRQWAGDVDRPLGLVEHYKRGGPDEGWHRLWDGCLIHHGLGLEHGLSQTRITAAMRGHLRERHGGGT